MSGPKESDYFLDEELRRQEEEERQRILEEEQCQILENELASEIETVKHLGLESTKLTQQTAELQKQLSETSHPSIQTIEYHHKSIQQITSKKVSVLDRTSKNLRQQVETIKRDIQAINNHLQTIRSEYSNLKAFTNMTQLHASEADLNNSFHRQAVKRHTLNEKVETTSEQLASLYEAFSSELQHYQTHLPHHQDIHHLLDAIQQLYHDENMDVTSKEALMQTHKKTFNATKETYEREWALKEKEQELFQAQFVTYKSLTSLLEVEMKPTESFEHSLEVLNKEIEFLNELYEKKYHNELVSETINEVMDDLGYHLIVSDEIHTPKREIDQRIYEFNNDNVINAYTSDNGTVLFEVTGVKENNDEMTELEKLRVKEGMDDFCSTFPTIQEKLKEKGVQISLKKSFPADVRFARSVSIKGMKEKEATITARKQKRKRLANPRQT